MTRWTAIAAVVLLAAAPARSPAQVSVGGGAVLGRADHRVSAGELVTSSGTLLGGSLVVLVGERFEVQGEALGGQLAAASTPSLDDHELADAHLLAGMKVKPWLLVQTGLSVRNYSNSLARQHWTTWRLGAEARLPLGFDGVTTMIRGSWMPIVNISGQPRPDVALGAGAGLEWRGRRIGVSALYSFERYDFPPTGGVQRLEDLSSLRLSVSLWWTPPKS